MSLFLMVIAGEIVLDLGFKAFFERARPDLIFDYKIPDTYSFPSGHAIASASFYGILAVIFARRLKSNKAKASVWAAAVTLIFVVGLSRVYFGVHYPSDVVAGWLAAAVWVFAGSRSLS